MPRAIEEIEEALETLALPPLISRADVKRQYRFLAKKNHPDKGGSPVRMEALNDAYGILIDYIETFRYSFDKEEMSKQFAGVDYVQKFKP